MCGMDSRYWSSLKSFSSRRSDEPDVEIENCGYSGSTTSLDILRETASGAAQARADLTSRMEERGGIEDIVTTWDGVGGGAHLSFLICATASSVNGYQYRIPT